MLRFKLIAWLCTIALLSTVDASASTWIRRPLAEHAAQAEVVARVRILQARLLFAEVDGKRYDCAGLYRAEVVDSLKGLGGEVEFTGSAGFELAGEYLVFLGRSDDVRNGIKWRVHSREEEAAVDQACREVVPPRLRENWQDSSEFFIRYDPDRGQAQDWVTAPFNVGLPEDRQLERHDIRVRAVAVDGKRVEADVEGRIWYERFPVPSDVWTYTGAVKWADYREVILASVRAAAPTSSVTPVEESGSRAGGYATMPTAESAKTTASRLDRAEESPGSTEQGAR